MLTIRYESNFKKDFKRIKKRGYNLKQLEKVIGLLAEQKPLPQKYKDHSLSGDYSDCRECHITPDWLLIYKISKDWLLIYKISKDSLLLILTRTGTHSDLF